MGPTPQTLEIRTREMGNQALLLKMLGLGTSPPTLPHQGQTGGLWPQKLRDQTLSGAEGPDPFLWL